MASIDLIPGFESFSINEASRRKVYKAAKQGSYPAVIVVVQDGKVIHQEPVSTPDIAPATFNVMQEKYPKALLHLEDKTGKRLFSESVNEAEKHEFNPNETAERLKRRETQNIERFRAAQEREDNYGIAYYKYRIAIDKIDLQKLKLMTQIHHLKTKYKK